MRPVSLCGTRQQKADMPGAQYFGSNAGSSMTFDPAPLPHCQHSDSHIVSADPWAVPQCVGGFTPSQCRYCTRCHVISKYRGSVGGSRGTLPLTQGLELRGSAVEGRDPQKRERRPRLKPTCKNVLCVTLGGPLRSAILEFGMVSPRNQLCAILEVCPSAPKARSARAS